MYSIIVRLCYVCNLYFLRYLVPSCFMYLCVSFLVLWISFMRPVLLSLACVFSPFPPVPFFVWFCICLFMHLLLVFLFVRSLSLMCSAVRYVFVSSMISPFQFVYALKVVRSSFRSVFMLSFRLFRSFCFILCVYSCSCFCDLLLSLVSVLCRVSCIHLLVVL